MPHHTYAVAIPAYNAEATLGPCLEALRAAQPQPEAVVVFDDGSTDRTADIARAAGVEVVTHAGPPLGPARGRNAAARESASDIILLVDSDVAIHPDAPALLIEAIAEDDNVAAAFGSYGVKQFGENVAARYANLRHHYVHQIAPREAETFWTGIGAVRRSAFEEIDGFHHSFERPSMEDIDFGYRLRQRGYRILLLPDAQGDHLKNWRLLRLWRDDVFSRAIPWSRMLIEGEGKASLNTGSKDRLAAVIAHLIWLFVLGSILFPQMLFLAVLCAIIYLALHYDFFLLLWRHGGWRTGLLGPVLHWVYHLYASVIFGGMLSMKRLGIGRAKAPTAAEG